MASVLERNWELTSAPESGVVQRQLSEFYCIYGDLVVVRVVADWRARTTILRKPEIVTPLARARGQIP